MISTRDCTDSPSSFYNYDCLLHPLSLALLDSSPIGGAKWAGANSPKVS